MKIHHQELATKKLPESHKTGKNSKKVTANNINDKKTNARVQ